MWLERLMWVLTMIILVVMPVLIWLVRGDPSLAVCGIGVVVAMWWTDKQRR